MGNAKIWPPPPLNPLTDRHQNEVMDIYHRAKFHPDGIRGYVFAHARFRASNCFLGYFFVFFLGGELFKSSPAKAPHGFWHKIRQKTRFRARTCLLGVAKPKVKLYTLLCPKNRHFGARFRWDKFSLENAFNIGHVVSKRPLVAIVIRSSIKVV